MAAGPGAAAPAAAAAARRQDARVTPQLGDGARDARARAMRRTRHFSGDIPELSKSCVKALLTAALRAQAPGGW